MDIKQLTVNLAAALAIFMAGLVGGGLLDPNKGPSPATGVFDAVAWCSKPIERQAPLLQTNGSYLYVAKLGSEEIHFSSRSTQSAVYYHQVRNTETGLNEQAADVIDFFADAQDACFPARAR